MREAIKQIRDVLRALELTEDEAQYIRGLIDARVRLSREYHTTREYDSKFGEAEPSGRD